MSEITEKQKRFADYFIKLGNATEAAIKAGYSKKTARVVGYENLTKPYIKKYIDKKLAEMASKRIADATEVMEYLTSVMRREHKEVIVVTLKQETSTYVPDENGTKRKKTVKREVPELVEIPSKLCDANKAAELLGKRYSLFTDKVNIEGALPVMIVGEDNLED